MSEDEKSNHEVPVRLNIRTDLALEAREMAADIKTELKGIKVVHEHNDFLNMDITEVSVLDEDGVKIIHKPVGKYITIECQDIKTSALDNKKDLVEAISEQLSKVTDFKGKKILIVGLGNQEVTPDALGPRVVSRMIVTRHLLKETAVEGSGLQEVSAIAPGVMGQTGMETLEIIKGVVRQTEPDLIVAIDALASRRTNRVNTTIQICDTGVHPGSGVGNRRKALTEKTLGIPVVAVGVPTVVDAATIVNDTIEELLKQLKAGLNVPDGVIDMILNMKDHEKYELVREILTPYVGNLLVTPKEIDEVIKRISDLLALSINKAVHPDMEYEELISWLS